MKLDNLQTVTLLFTRYRSDGFAPENDGEYDVEKLGGRVVLPGTQFQITEGQVLAKNKALHAKLHDDIKKEHAGWMVPRVKVRHDRAVWQEFYSQD